MTDINLQTASSPGSQVIDLDEEWLSDSSVEDSVDGSVGDNMEATEHEEEIGDPDAQDQQGLPAGSILEYAAVGSGSTELGGQFVKSEDQDDCSSPLAYRFKEFETPTHSAIQHEYQSGAIKPSNITGALQRLPVGSATQTPIGRTFGPTESLFKKYGITGPSQTRSFAASAHGSRFGQAQGGDRNCGSSPERGFNAYGAPVSSPPKFLHKSKDDHDSEDDSLFFKESPDARANRLKHLHGKNDDGDFNDERLSHFLKPNKKSNRIAKPSQKGKSRNGKPQGVDNIENEMIFQLYWDRGMSFNQIAKILNDSNAQSTHDTDRKTEWGNGMCNNRYGVNGPKFFKPRGIPYVRPSDCNKAKQMEHGFDANWRENLKWVVRQFDEQKMRHLVKNFEEARKKDIYKDPSLAAIVQKFEGKSKWIAIKKLFDDKVAQSMQNPTFGMWDSKKKTLVRCKAKDIKPFQLKVIYARILNSEFLKNPAVNCGNHSGIKRGFEVIPVESAAADDDDSEKGSDEGMGSTESFDRGQEEMDVDESEDEYGAEFGEGPMDSPA